MASVLDYGLCVRLVHKFHDFFMTPSLALEHKSQPPTSNLDLGIYLNNKERFFRKNYTAHEMDVSAG